MQEDVCRVYTCNGDYIGDWVLLERIKMNFNVSPPVEFTNLVHQSSPLVQSSDCRHLNFSSQSSVLLYSSSNVPGT